MKEARYAGIQKKIDKASRRAPGATKVYIKLMGTADIRAGLEMGGRTSQTMSVAQLEGTNVGITTVLMEFPSSLPQDAPL